MSRPTPESSAGFTAAVPPGFAQLMPKKAVVSSPSRSFAAAMKIGEAQLAAERLGSSTAAQTIPRKKRQTAKPQREFYPWPEMFVASKLATRGEKPWEQYSTILEHSARSHNHIGRFVGTKNLMLVFIGSNELHSAMNERYTGTAQHPYDGKRKDMARKTVSTINQVIRRLQESENVRRFAAELTELSGLQVAATDIADDEAYLTLLEQARIQDEVITQPELPPLWQSRMFEVSAQEGYGKYGIGLAMRETGYYSVRRELIGELCSSQGLNFNPLHFKDDLGPVVQLLDTYPLPADGLKYTLPGRGMPADLLAQAPRAFGIGI